MWLVEESPRSEMIRFILFHSSTSRVYFVGIGYSRDKTQTNCFVNCLLVHYGILSLYFSHENLLLILLTSHNSTMIVFS